MMDIDRRELLLGTGAIVLAPSGANAGVTLTLTKTDTGFDVRKGGQLVWSINVKSLAPGSWERAEHGGVFEAVITDAKLLNALPAPLRFSLTFAFFQQGGDWRVRAHWTGLGPAGIHKSAPARIGEALTTPLPMSAMEVFARSLPTVILPSAGRLVVDRDLAIDLDLHHSAPARIVDLQTSVLRLAPKPGSAPDGWLAEGAAKAGFRHAQRKAGDLLLRWPEATGVSVLKGDYPAQLHGRLSLTTGDGIEFTCASADIKGTAKDFDIVVVPAAGAARARGLHLTIDGGSPGTITAKKGKLEQAELPLAVLEAAVRVQSADQALLAFDSGSIKHLRLMGDAKALGSAIQLEASHGAALGLASGRLRLRRGADLLDLGFRFKNMALHADASGKLSLRRLGHPDHADGEAAYVMAVDFPPQHIMERSFLRQDPVLPDAGNPLNAAQKRILARGGEDADTLRETIFGEKKDATPASDPTGFLKFADAWTKGSQRKAWIGPDGLFSLSERQQARRLALAMTRTARDEAKKSLQAASVDPSAISQALIKIPLPRVVIDRTGAAAEVKDLGGKAAFDALVKYLRGQDSDYASLAMPPVFWKFVGDQKTPSDGWPLTPEDLVAINYTGPLASDGEMVTFLLRVIAQRESAEAELGDGPEGLRRPVAARVAGCSRLAFEVKTDLTDLSVKSLTEWHDPTFGLMQVVERAQKFDVRNDDLAKFLKHQGFVPGDKGVSARMASIRKAFANPIDDFTTSIELPTRLLLSPAETVKWEVPPGSPPLVGATPVWSARLLDEKDGTLRAVGSPDFRPDDFNESGLGIPTEPNANAAPPWFRAGLSADDRHELVALSSVYGLPIVGLDPAASGQAKRLSSAVRTPNDFLLGKLDEQADEEQAMYVPRALGVQHLSLAAIGATFRASTSFDPPVASFFTADPSSENPTPKSKRIFPTLGIERWDAQIVDGSDIVTTVLRRGYLLPFGQLAALVKQTTPRLRWAVNGFVTEQATRFFILVGRDLQSYPASGQADDGRATAMRSVKILTTRTPDLVDPTTGAPAPDKDLKVNLRGRVEGAALVGLSFWPRTQLGVGGTVNFQMQVNVSDGAVNMPLLFVDNAAVNDPDTLDALCQHYNEHRVGDGKPQDWSKLRHAGASLAYALENKKGDTSLLTNWQLWKVGGRERLADNGILDAKHRFKFDGSLQAAKQPPFYPLMHHAEVMSKQISGLTASAATPFLVKMHDDFVKLGFDENSPDKIFLQVLDRTTHPRPSLDMGEHGERSGGVGRLAMPLGVWDRTLGPRGVVLPDNEAREGRSVGLEVAKSGAALDSFGDKAMLLGLIALRDFVKMLADDLIDAAQPLIEEITEYTQQGVVTKTLSAISQAICHAQAAIRDNIGPTPNALKPLDAAMNALKKALTGDDKSCDATPLPTDPVEAAGTVSQILVQGRRLLDEIERIAAYPLGPAAEAARGALLQFFDAGELGELSTALQTSIANELASLAGDAHYGVLFLRVPGMDPALADAGEAALRQAAGKPSNWLDPKPLDAILRDIKKDPKLSSALKSAVANDLVGPAWEWCEPLLDRLAIKTVSGFERFVSIVQGVAQPLVALVDNLTALKEKASTLCDRAVNALDKYIDAALPNLGTTTSFIHGIGGGLYHDIGDAIGVLQSTVPDLVDPQAKAVRDIVAKLTAYQQAFGTALDAYNARKASLVSPSVCADILPASFLAALDDLRARRHQLDAAALGIESVWTSLQVPLVPGPAKELTAWNKAVSTLAATIGAALAFPADNSLFSSDASSKLDSVIEALSMDAPPAWGTKTAANLEELAGQIKTFLNDAANLAQPSSDLRLVIDTAKTITAEARSLQLAVEAGEPVTAMLRSALQAAMAPLAAKALDNVKAAFGRIVVPLYGLLLDARATAFDAARKSDELLGHLFGQPGGDASWCHNGWAEAVLLLPRDGAANCTIPDAFNDEADQAKSDPGGIATLWNKGNAAPQRLVDHAKHVADLAIQAVAQNWLPLDDMRKEVEAALASLLPFRTTLTSKLTLPLKPLEPFPGISFNPDGPEPLALSSNVKTTFVPPKVEGSFLGAVPPFKLGILEIFVVHFSSGITYEGGTGQPGKLTAHLNAQDVSLLGSLSFLSDLEEHLSMGDPNQGPYSRVHLDRPSLEAGYNLFIEAITLGIVFTNINFSASMLLPFDDREARLRLALSSLDSPFTISAGIYGGTGFFGCEASARGIEVFEASFQFGGVAAIGFGPLVGIGYIVTGAYIRKDANGALFTALFSAGFSAHIACFSISATFTLRLSYDSGNGGMAGEAILTFTFKVGFVPIEFQVRAHRNMGHGFDKGGAAAQDTWLEDDGRIRYAEVDCKTKTDANPELPNAYLINYAVVAEEEWPEYIGQFDEAFQPVWPA